MASNKEYVSMRERAYGSYIRESSKKSVVYSSDVPGIYSIKPLNVQNDMPQIIFEQADPVSALFKYAQGKTAVLNCGSYTNPGGDFLDGGSSSAEAVLCSASTLCNVLARQEDFYAGNLSHINKGFYSDRALYSPKIIFEDKKDGKRCMCSVITGALPEIVKLDDRTARFDALLCRLRFLFNVAIAEGVKTLIVGSLGTDEDVTGKVLEACVLNDCGCFDRIVFAEKDAQAFNQIRLGYESAASASVIHITHAGDAALISDVLMECGTCESRERVLDTVRLCMDGEGMIYFIRYGAEIVGVLNLNLADSFCDIRTIAIKPGFRRKGIGKGVPVFFQKIRPDVAGITCTLLQRMEGVEPFLTSCGFLRKGIDNYGDIIYALQKQAG